MENSNADYLLSFAVTAYVNERVGISERGESVNIKFGDKTETIEVSGLEVRFVNVTEHIDEIIFSDMSDGVEVSYEVVESIDDLENVKGSFDSYFGEQYVDESGSVYYDICFDLSSLDDETGVLRLTLPDSLRLDADVNSQLPYGYYVSDRNVNEFEITKWCDRETWNNKSDSEFKQYSDQISIKTTVRYPGSFKLESAVFTTLGDEYYVSKGVMFELE